MVDVCSNNVLSRCGDALRRRAVALWPPTCVLCRSKGQTHARYAVGLDLCAGCAADLPANMVACRACAQPLASEWAAQLLCGACLRRQPRYDTTVAPYRYSYPIDHLIRALKYHGRVACGRVLGELLAQHIGESDIGDRPSVLLPVPLGAARFRARGYNQALELARCIGSAHRIPVRADMVTRVRDTPEQAGLDQRGRRRNIRGAFAFAAAGRAPAHVAIVDDVVTTGSTVNELARVLKRNGARRVDVWAVARAGR